MADSVRWSPQIESLANEVLQKIAEESADPYNAVHLRIEKDAKDWAQIMGGIDVRDLHIYSQQAHSCLCSFDPWPVILKYLLGLESISESRLARLTAFMHESAMLHCLLQLCSRGLE